MPTRRVAADLDLLTFSLLQARMHPLAADPSGLGAGDGGRVWFNTTAKRFKFWSGTGVIDPIDRASHVGSQLASTISDLTAAILAQKWQDMAVPTQLINANGQRIGSVADPTGAQDVATRNYVDTALSGLVSGQIIKGSVRVATTANVNIASAPANVDGVALTNGDVVLLAGQTTPAQNGPYVWTAAGAAMTRATNWDTSAEAVLGSFWDVREGTNADTFALLTNDTPINLGTTAPAFVFRGAASASYTASTGLTIVGSDIRAVQGVGIVIGSSIAVDTTIVGRKVVGTIPVASTAPFSVSGANVTMNHQLGNLAADIRVVYGPAGAVPGAPVDVDFNNTDGNNSLLTLPTAPALNQYIVSAIG